MSSDSTRTCPTCAHRPHQPGGCKARYLVDGKTTDPCLCENWRAVSDSPRTPRESLHDQLQREKEQRIRREAKAEAATPPASGDALREALELAVKHFVPTYGPSESGTRPDAAARIRAALAASGSITVDDLQSAKAVMWRGRPVAPPLPEGLDARDPIAQAKFALHRYARTTEDARDINHVVDALVARLQPTSREATDEQR